MMNVNKLIPDVFAGDVLRREYRRQMDDHAMLAAEAESLRERLEHVEARQKTAAERATSIMETLSRYGGMLPPEPEPKQ
jgi:regulator of replication initiation timing